MEKLNILRRVINLTTGAFVLRANQRDFDSETATYTVPNNRMNETIDELVQMKLMTRESFSFTTATGVTTHTLVLTHDIAPDPALAMVGGVAVVVRRTPTPVAEITTYTVALPRTIHLTGLAAGTAHTFDVYYLFGAGRVNLSVLTDDGTAQTRILESSIRAVNMLNQVDDRMGLRLGRVGVLVPEDFRIQVRVVTPAAVIWHGATETAFSSPFARESFINLQVNDSNMLEWPAGIALTAKEQVAGIVE